MERRRQETSLVEGADAMGNNNALNSHFREFDQIQIDPPDELANPRRDLIISSFQCDATVSDHFLFAVTVRNIGSAKAVIPATIKGGSLTFGLVALHPNSGLVAIHQLQSLRLNLGPSDPLEVEPGEEFSRVFNWGPISTAIIDRPDYLYAVADLLQDRPLVGFGYPLRVEDFIRMGNNVAMIPIIWR